MGLVQTAKQIWRDCVTDGVPGSGKWKPEKSEIRAWGTALEAATNLLDGLDIRSYIDGAALFGQYAVEGIQAAIDANETDLLLFPKGVILFPIAWSSGGR